MNPSRAKPRPGAESELLILPDGRILAHNLTATMAAVLRELNPEDAEMGRRADLGGVPLDLGAGSGNGRKRPASA